MVNSVCDGESAGEGEGQWCEMSMEEAAEDAWNGKRHSTDGILGPCAAKPPVAPKITGLNN